MFWVVCALGFLLVMNHLVLVPIDNKLQDMDEKIQRLRAAMAEVPRKEDVDRLRGRIESVEHQFNLPIADLQREFRDNLESQIDPAFVSSLAPYKATRPSKWPGKRIVTFTLKLELSNDDLGDVLEMLDSYRQPLRVDSVTVKWGSQNDQTLTVDLVVSTLGKAEAGSS